jgi:hypothetical protein
VTEIIAMVALTVQTLILTIIVISVYRQSQHIKQSEEAQAAKESTAEKIPAPQKSWSACANRLSKCLRKPLMIVPKVFMPTSLPPLKN